MKTQKLHFEQKSPICFVALYEPIRRRYDGTEFKGLTAVRLIKEAAGWRIDKTDAVAGAWMPWEALSPTCFPTQRTAAWAAKTLFGCA